MPGTLGDPARFVEALPGVTPTASGLQSFFVRGEPPETTGYFLDGISVPALYHIGFGPSVVHPALLDRVEFFPGAAPATYGRVIGGVIINLRRYYIDPALAGSMADSLRRHEQNGDDGP